VGLDGRAGLEVKRRVGEGGREICEAADHHRACDVVIGRYYKTPASRVLCRGLSSMAWERSNAGLGASTIDGRAMAPFPGVVLWDFRE